MLEKAILSASENLYKYMVTLGLIICISAFYYPIREKHVLDLEIIKLESEVDFLKSRTDSMLTESREFKKNKLSNASNAERDLFARNLSSKLSEYESAFRTLSLKEAEIAKRKEHNLLYSTTAYIAIPFGFFLICFGFYHWYCSKKNEDEIATLHKEDFKQQLQRKKIDP